MCSISLHLLQLADHSQNIGLQARILSTRTFTIFVFMALVTTVSATPLTTFLYPPWYQKKLESWKRGETDWEGNQLNPLSADTPPELGVEKMLTTQIRRLLDHLRLDSLPSLFTFIALVGGEQPALMAKTHRLKAQLSTVPEIVHSSRNSSSAPLSKTPLGNPRCAHGGPHRSHVFCHEGL